MDVRAVRMTRVAAIDCGTNSIRLLIAEPGEGGVLVDVAREMRIVRLGQGVDRTGRLAPEAIARTREALVEYTELIDKLGASAIRMVATSATRDAINRDEFTTMVRAVLGAAPEVITGAEEAALSFAGAVAGLPDAASPVLVAEWVHPRTCGQRMRHQRVQALDPVRHAAGADAGDFGHVGGLLPAL